MTNQIANFFYGTQTTIELRIYFCCRRNPDASSATLAVTPQQAVLLVTAEQQNLGGSRFWLALRPFGERGGADVPECSFA